MAGDPNRSDGAFLTYLQKICAICMKYGEDAIVPKFVRSIPNGFIPRKQKKKQAKGKTWKCRKCKKTYKTNGGFLRHKVTCKQGQTKRNNNIRKDTKRQPKLCLLCNKKSKLITYHYSKFHKIDYYLWKKKRSDKDNHNSTTCPECDDDYFNKTSLHKHFRDYHKINIRLLWKKQNRSLKVTNVEKRKTSPTERERELIEEAKGTVEDNSDPQEERDRGPAAREEITENSNIQDELERANVQRLCLECNEYQQASLFESHIASHVKERESHEFMTSNTQSTTNRHEGNSNHSHVDTVEKIRLRKRGDKYVVVSHSYHGSVDQSEMRNDTNQSEEELRTRDSRETAAAAGETDSGRDNAKKSQDVYIPQNKRRTSHEIRRKSNTDKIARKRRAEMSGRMRASVSQDNNKDIYVHQNKIRADELRRNANNIEKDARKRRVKMSERKSEDNNEDTNVSQNRRSASNELGRNADTAQVEKDARILSAEMSARIQAGVSRDNNKYINVPQNKIRANELRRNANNIEKDAKKRRAEMSGRIHAGVSRDNNKDIYVPQNKMRANELRRNANNIEKDAKKRRAEMSGLIHASVSQNNNKDTYAPQNKVRTSNVVKIEKDLRDPRVEKNGRTEASVSQHNNEYICVPQNKIRFNELRSNFTTVKIEKDERKPRTEISGRNQATVSQDNNENLYVPQNKKCTTNELRRNSTIVKIEQDARKRRNEMSGRIEASVEKDNNEDIYVPQSKTRATELQRNFTTVKIEEDERKPCAKLLWSEYYQRIKLETDKTVQQKLFDEFLLRRGSQAAVDEKPNVVDAVSATVSSTSTSGNRPNRPLMYLKIIKYD